MKCIRALPVRCSRSVIAGLLLSMLGMARADPISIEAFAQQDVFTSLKPSTDGKAVAAIAGSRREGLVFIDSGTREITRLVKVSDEPIFDFHWISPNRVVVFPE